MNKLIGAAVAVLVLAAPARADDPAAVVEKAAKAMGGEVRLKAPGAMTRSKATITFGGMEFEADLATTFAALDKIRSEFAGDFGGMRVTALSVISGDKGWQRMNDDTMDMDADALAREKRNAYLAAVAANPLLLKTKDFKVTAAADEKVDGQPAAVLKGTGPDGKEFAAYFDKASGLPVKLTAPKVAGFMGDEADQVWTFTDYKDFDGVKRASKTVVTRDGEKFITQTVVEYKTLDKLDPKAFDKP